MIFNEIEITNFRGIKHLLLPNLKQINLFVGKNNCGKSSVLDAMFILSGFSNPTLSISVNKFRDYLSITEEDLALNFYNMIPTNHIWMCGNMADGTVRELKITPIASESQILLSKEDLSSQALSNKEANVISGLTMNFSYTQASGAKKSGRTTIRIDKEEGSSLKISRSKEYKETITSKYINSNLAFAVVVHQLTRIIEEKQEHVIVEILQHVEPKIQAIAVLKSGVSVDIGLDRLIPINMLGDGIRKLLNIITSLYECKNGAIFIDEIDNGMHFSSLSSLWKAIIKTATLLNVQVFATTHSIESLQSLNKVLSDSDCAESKQDIMCYSLRHLPSDELKAYEYPYEKFEYVIQQEIEIR